MRCPTCSSEVYPGPTCSACGAPLGRSDEDAARDEPVLATAPAAAPLRYQFLGSNASAVARIELAVGQTLNVQAEALAAKSEHLEETPQYLGGATGALHRMVGRSSLPVSSFTPVGGPGELLLSPALPGELIAIDLKDRSLLVHSSAWLASEPSVALDLEFGGFGGLFWSQSLFFVRLSGSGVVFLSPFGALVRRPLPAGGRYLVDIGHLVAFDARLPFQVLRRRNGASMKSRVMGEPHLVALTGPGEVWLQTRGLKSLAGALLPLFPSSGKGGGWSKVNRE